jgi:hypothetical protein
MKIKWGKETRQTNYGTFRDGDIVDLSEEIAKDFVNQGLASYNKITKYDNPEGEEESPPVRKRRAKEE